MSIPGQRPQQTPVTTPTVARELRPMCSVQSLHSPQQPVCVCVALIGSPQLQYECSCKPRVLVCEQLPPLTEVNESYNACDGPNTETPPEGVSLKSNVAYRLDSQAPPTIPSYCNRVDSIHEYEYIGQK